jgi:hypothetical protein
MVFLAFETFDLVPKSVTTTLNTIVDEIFNKKFELVPDPVGTRSNHY